MVGASAALVHFLVLIGVVHFLSVSPIWANVIAFLFAFMVSFTGHFYLTFRSSERETIQTNTPSYKQRNIGFIKKNTLHALIKWFASSAAGFLVNQVLFIIGLHWFGERYYILIWLVITAIITVMTFALGKLWAFKP